MEGALWAEPRKGSGNRRAEGTNSDQSTGRPSGKKKTWFGTWAKDTWAHWLSNRSPDQWNSRLGSYSWADNPKRERPLESALKRTLPGQKSTKNSGGLPTLDPTCTTRKQKSRRWEIWAVEKSIRARQSLNATRSAELENETEERGTGPWLKQRTRQITGDQNKSKDQIYRNQNRDDFNRWTWKAQPGKENNFIEIHTRLYFMAHFHSNN
jgi:hypothetical protein